MYSENCFFWHDLLRKWVNSVDINEIYFVINFFIQEDLPANVFKVSLYERFREWLGRQYTGGAKFVLKPSRGPPWHPEVS